MSIRVIALGVLKRVDGAILLEKGEDRIKNEFFYRPLGGGVEFGETAKQALIREFQEELGAKIIVHELLDVTENIFTYEGEKGHQIVFIYECSFDDGSYYQQDKIKRLDKENAYAVWHHLEEIEKLYPKDIISLLN